MSWFKGLFGKKTSAQTNSARMFLDAATVVFDRICTDENASVSDIYRKDPELREYHWKAISQTVFQRGHRGVL